MVSGVVCDRAMPTFTAIALDRLLESGTSRNPILKPPLAPVKVEKAPPKAEVASSSKPVDCYIESSSFEGSDQDGAESSSFEGSDQDGDSAYGSWESDDESDHGSWEFDDPSLCGGSKGRFERIFAILEDDAGTGAQLAAPTELCEVLSFCMEDSPSYFPLDTSVPVLVRLAGQETSPDAMLLAVRALTYLCDVMPRSSDAIVWHGALPVLCGKLLAIDYLDVAEQCLQALEKISREEPVPCLKAGTIMAVLRSGRNFKSINDLSTLMGDPSPIKEKTGLSLSVVKSLVPREKEEKQSSEFYGYEEFHSLICSLFKSEEYFIPRKNGSFSEILPTTTLPKDLHGAPPDSFVVQLSQIIGDFKSLQKMASFWRCVIVELRYIDFFSTSIQRVALSTVANVCKKLPLDCSSLVMESVPSLCTLLQCEDWKLVEIVAVCLIRITDCFSHSPDLLDELCKHGVIHKSLHLIATNGWMSLSQNTYAGLIGLLTKLATSSLVAARTLFELHISSTLRNILMASCLSHGTYSPFEDVQSNQVLEVLKFLNQLIPPVTRDIEDIQLVLAKENILADQPSFLHQFSMDIIPALVTTKDAGDAVTLLQSLAGSTFDSSQLVLTACMGYQAVNETKLHQLRDKHRPSVIAVIEERSKGLRVWMDSTGLATKLYSFKRDPGALVSEANSTDRSGDMNRNGDLHLESKATDLDGILGNLTVDAELDSLPDIKEQAVWLKVELPDDVFISDVFNIRHLTPYAGENSSLRSSFSEEGVSDEDISSDPSSGQSNQSLDVPVPATQSQQATSGKPTPGSLRRSKRLQNKRA